jgi:hypothetical protein
LRWHLHSHGIPSLCTSLAMRKVLVLFSQVDCSSSQLHYDEERVAECCWNNMERVLFYVIRCKIACAYWSQELDICQFECATSDSLAFVYWGISARSMLLGARLHVHTDHKSRWSAKWSPSDRTQLLMIMTPTELPLWLMIRINVMLVTTSERPNI